MSHVFISYSRQDKDYAQKLAQKLRNEGFEVWIDNRIQSGDYWWDTIDKAISDAIAFIVIMTPSSKDSNWVKREILLADDRKKPVFPLLLEGENWSFYVHTQYEDVRNRNLTSQMFIDRLKQFITGKTKTINQHSSKELLRFDGAYVYKMRKNSYHYLCFSPDGKVAATLLGKIDINAAKQEISTSDRPTVVRSEYILNGTQIDFKFSVVIQNTLVERTHMNGFVRENSLELFVTNLLDPIPAKNAKLYGFMAFD